MVNIATIDAAFRDRIEAITFRQKVLECVLATATNFGDRVKAAFKPCVITDSIR